MNKTQTEFPRSGIFLQRKMHKGRQEVLKITEPNKQKEKSSPEVYLVNDFH